MTSNHQINKIKSVKCVGSVNFIDPGFMNHKS